MCSIEPNDDSKCLPVPDAPDDAPVYVVTPPVILDHATGAPCVPVGPSGARVIVFLTGERDDEPPVRESWAVRVFDGQAVLPHNEHPMKALEGAHPNEVLSAAISFLLAASESYEYHGAEAFADPDYAATLFPVATVLWAHQMSDELAIAQMEVEGNL